MITKHLTKAITMLADYDTLLANSAGYISLSVLSNYFSFTLQITDTALARQSLVNMHKQRTTTTQTNYFTCFVV